jgi:hypothetical protein
MARSSGRRGHVPYRILNVTSVRRKIQSGAADPQCQYRSRPKDQFSDHPHPLFRTLANQRATIENNLAANCVPRGQVCQIWGKRNGA